MLNERQLLKKAEWVRREPIREPLPDELRWELGERVMRNGWAVPGGFVFVYGAVIGYKWSVRALRRCFAARQAPAPLLRLPPPLKALPPPDGEGLRLPDL